MTREAATAVIALLLESTGKLDATIALVKDNCSPEEFDNYRRAIGKILGELYLDVIEHIFKEHPEVRPDHLK